MKKVVQVLTVMFALSLFAIYLVYSQNQHTPQVIPGSKARVLDGFKEQWVSSNYVAASTNLIVPSDATITNVAVQSIIIAPGSKSAAVFVPPPPTAVGPPSNSPPAPAVVTKLSPKTNPPPVAPDNNAVNTISMAAAVFRPSPSAPVASLVTNSSVAPTTQTNHSTNSVK